MPLETVPDLFDDATHSELDRVVEKYVEVDLGNVSDLSANWQYANVLNAIVTHGKDSMDSKFLVMNEVNNLVRTQEELRLMLASAWRRKSYREIRNLAILRAPQSESKPSTPTPTASTDTLEDLYQKLSGSFGAKYRGAAADGFYEYLTHNEKLFKTVNNPRFYAKFCSIVQSSGTGKSRMLTELSKKGVIVIYMNLRGEKDKLGFPPRDPIPSQILTQFPLTEGAYRTVCYAFFIALFDTLEEYLSTGHATRNAKAGVIRWVRQMCDMSDPPVSTARADFFRKVHKRYSKVHADLTNAFRRRPSATSEDTSMSDRDETDNDAAGTDVDEAADKLRELTLSEASALASDQLEPDSAARLITAYEKMASSLEKIFADDFDRPKLVVAVDEAHPLTPLLTQGTYRPADVFCRVVNVYSHHQNHAVWVVFASTTSKVADFSPPNQKHNSDRVAVSGQKLFLPYTQLGWDQSALGLGEIDIEDVSRVHHIVGYGRPLWVSLKTALTLPGRVLDTASAKLCGGDEFDPSKTGHVIAVLGQRFGLNVTFGHPDSVEHLESGVASHLRICLATTMDRNWRFTSYPSEPLLSCVAARGLHAVPGKLKIALGTLLKAVNSGMIDVGQRGELASRLLWLLAKDLFVRTQAKVVNNIPSSWDEHLIDCQMIPVVDWLEFIFGTQMWNADDNQASLAHDMFKDAYINFSHWVCMEANIAGSNEGNELRLEQWTLRHWQRTSAVQCCHQQPVIDKAIPIYFKGGPEGASAESRMSHVFISDKARRSKDSKKALHRITRRHENLRGKDGTSDPDSDPLPYIAILADLGQPSSFSLTFPERNTDDRCLRIYAAGVDTVTYPFLGRYPAIMDALQDLVHLQQIPETETPCMEYLSAQVKFGSTATPEHMLWEHGRQSLNVSGRTARRS
ncbi:hypothetical protein HD554DRAFT_2315779 [Boletus coccyginus]|nr:hypothetical protein HD554DRAFT_2315779 [Boletus coccyginus]